MAQRQKYDVALPFSYNLHAIGRIAQVSYNIVSKSYAANDINFPLRSFAYVSNPSQDIQFMKVLVSPPHTKKRKSITHIFQRYCGNGGSPQIDVALLRPGMWRNLARATPNEHFFRPLASLRNND